MSVRVHVHAAHGRDQLSWGSAFDAGRVHSRYAYGYEYAESRMVLTYSVDGPKGRLVDLLRKVQRRVLGFDLAHAWRNRAALRSADVIWTHTEYEWIPVVLLQRLGLAGRALVVAQSVWLWDRWRAQSAIRRGIARAVIDRVAIHTTLSPVNAAVARGLTSRPVRFVPFGIEPLAMLQPCAPRPPRPSILALGNDRDRDWGTLLGAAAASPESDFVIISSTFDVPYEHLPNVTVLRKAGREVILAAYARASVVAVPLSPNGHASGITVALEAVSLGIPVVASATGGIEVYLEGIGFLVPSGDVKGLTEGIQRAVRGSGPRVGGTLGDRGLTARDYAERHVCITEALVAARPVPEAVSALAPLH